MIFISFDGEKNEWNLRQCGSLCNLYYSVSREGQFVEKQVRGSHRNVSNFQNKEKLVEKFDANFTSGVQILSDKMVSQCDCPFTPYILHERQVALYKVTKTCNIFFFYRYIMEILFPLR